MANPPGTIIARVIGVNIQGSTIHVTVGAGTDRGVVQRSSCQLIDDNNQPAETGACTIVRLDKLVTVLKATVKFDQIRVYSRALLIPPP